MKSSQATPTIEYIINLAKKAGAIAREGYLQAHEIGYKGATDLVTEIDHRCEKLILDAIRSDFPDHSILAEESGAVNSGSKDCWYVDPLDGTINYAHQIPIYCISIAFQGKDGESIGVVYAPQQDECFTAQKGKGALLNSSPIRPSACKTLQQSLTSTSFTRNSEEGFSRNLHPFTHLSRTTLGTRRMGCAALETCYVACGRLDAYWELAINAWDIAAAALIVEEAGGVVTTPEGSPEYFKPPYAILSCAPGIHKELVALMKSIPVSTVVN